MIVKGSAQLLKKLRKLYNMFHFHFISFLIYLTRVKLSIIHKLLYKLPCAKKYNPLKKFIIYNIQDRNNKVKEYG